jgi:hypothetical protein
VLLAQSDDQSDAPGVDTAARRAAERLGLAYERVFVGRGGLAAIITGAV